MKRWMISVLCAAMIIISGCSADPDLILQTDVSAEDERASADDSGRDIVMDASEESSPAEETGKTSGNDVSDGTGICVYICGAVNSPGVYELEDGDRIYQLVEMAGGLTEDADEQSVNLAQTVADGEMVYIPTEEESAAGSGAPDGDTASGASADEEGKININTATAAELTALSGIGDAKAAAIVAYREEHGSFQNIEEIMLVDGIAEATYSKIKDEITV